MFGIYTPLIGSPSIKSPGRSILRDERYFRSWLFSAISGVKDCHFKALEVPDMHRGQVISNQVYFRFHLTLIVRARHKITRRNIPPGMGDRCFHNFLLLLMALNAVLSRFKRHGS